MKKVISIVLLGLAAAFVLPAQATVVPTVNLDTVYTGYTPGGPSPWLTATYTSTGSNTGYITLISNLTSGEKVQGAGVTGWAFYLNDSISSASCTGGSVCPADPILTSSSDIHPPNGLGLGTYNLGFNWANNANGVFGYGDTAIISLIFADPTTDPFAMNTAGWYSYAHVQGIGPNGSCSGYIVAGSGTPNYSGLYGTCGSTPPPHNVPEPNDLGIFGIGLLLVGMFLGMNRRRFFG